jgi:hypothetical protein
VTDRPPTTDIPDPIRAAKTSDTGDLGEKAAEKVFAELHWPTTPTTAAQDLGTDLLIAARDRGFHRGEYLLAQVKSGESNLDSPISGEDGEQVGWWVEVKAKHANYWIDSAIPHILVLYDHDTDSCHWADLTKETITVTGRGRKVKVLLAQVVAPEQSEALLAIAARARTAVPLEGTAWTGAAPKAATDHLRFALIAPRLLAPHPNSGAAPETPAEAVALLMQARREQVWPLGSPHSCVPSREEAATHDLWAWRFVAALAEWLTTEKTPDFEELRGNAPAVFERAAVSAVIGHRQMAAGDPESARALLQAEIDDDRLAPVDRAWLHLQLARAQQELADLEEARRAAALSLAIGATQPHDVTATAIRGVAAAILFDTSAFEEKDIASTIRYSDTAVGWWRSQTAYRGSVALIETAFDRAVDHEPSEHDEVRANNEIFAASVQAGVLGSHGQWRFLSGLLARQNFIDPRRSDADAFAENLGVLRRAGAEGAIARATWWVTANGPGDAVTAAAREIDLNRSTSSSILADTTVLRVGGDVIGETTAVRAADWLLAALADPTHLLALTHRMAYDTEHWVATQLKGIFQAIPREGAERTVAAIERHGEGFGVLAAREWGELLVEIPRWAWTPDQAARLLAIDRRLPEDALHAAIAYVAQAFDPAARRSLLKLIDHGRLWAFGYIDDPAALDPAEIEELRDIYIAQIEKDRAAEREGTSSRGASRPLDDLVALAVARPGGADDAWDTVEQTIADPVMPAWYKKRAIVRVANERESIGDTRLKALAAAVDVAAKAPPSERWRAGDADMSTEVAFASVILDGSPERRMIETGRMAGGGLTDRRFAARLADEARDVATLSVLVADRSPIVRGEAAYGLARAASEDEGGDPRVLPALRRAVVDRGWNTGVGVAQVIAEAPDQGVFAELRELLADHPSREVRWLAGGRCGAGEDPTCDPDGE